MKCGNLVEICFRLNLVVKGFKETKWTGLLARTRPLFPKKIVIAVFDFGPEKRALHYTRHDTWRDSQEEGQQLNMAT